MIRVKICGITNQEDIHVCASAGVDALGFVVEYPIPVPWNLKRDRALELMSEVPPFVSKVAVVGDSLEGVMDIVKLLRPDAVQLHGREPFRDTIKLVQALKLEGVQVIKAMRFSVTTGELIWDLKDPIEACSRLIEIGTDAVVLDSVSESRPAGTGVSFDWGVARMVTDRVDIPIILAGGLNPKNIYNAIAKVRPYGVDVISGVEALDGKKDPFKVKSFMREVKRACGGLS